MKKKLTPSIRKKITNDWYSELQSLVIYEPLHLLRRLGPFLEGIVLDRSSGNEDYLATFHLHNLAILSDGEINLGLYTPFCNSKGAKYRITVLHHDKSFREIISSFKKQFPLKVEGSVRCDALLQAYQKYIDENGALTQYPRSQWFDMLTALIWCNRLMEAKVFYDKCISDMASWPDRVKEYSQNKLQEFYNLKSWIEHPEAMKSNVEESLEQLHAQNLPSAELLP